MKAKGRTIVLQRDDFEHNAEIYGVNRCDPSEEWNLFITCVFHCGRLYDFRSLVECFCQHLTANCIQEDEARTQHGINNCTEP